LKKIAILQSNYIPWKGYFDLIASVDEFILFDDADYTKNDWRNRNQIKTQNGLQWLTIPILSSGNFGQKICEACVDSRMNWGRKHWNSLVGNYKRAACFDEISELLEPLYRDNTLTHLSAINRLFIETICSYLGIKTTISATSDYNLLDEKTERLVDICKQANATEYISGPAAKNYIMPELFEVADIKLKWFDYAGYQEYPQLWGGEFYHNVSIVDLLFNCGKDAPQYMKLKNLFA